MNTLKTLLYFSIFKYPLKIEEIYMFSNLKNKNQLEIELADLLKNEIIFKIGNYYLCENKDGYVKRRIDGNQMAEKVFIRAKRISQFIAKFPFVEGVGISGSLSKGYHDKDSDIDFFIITTSQRLWVARTLLILYKKLFLLNSKKYFCINYFISSDDLEINEKNRFTATELITLIPVCGKDSFQSFYKNNLWARKYYPNYFKSYEIEEIKKPFLCKQLELILNTSIGNDLDALFFKLTYKKWKQKFKTLDSNDFKIAMKSTKSVSKHHPQNFQKTVIDTLNEKYSKVYYSHNIILETEHA